MGRLPSCRLVPIDAGQIARSREPANNLRRVLAPPCAVADARLVTDVHVRGVHGAGLPPPCVVGAETSLDALPALRLAMTPNDLVTSAANER